MLDIFLAWNPACGGTALGAGNFNLRKERMREFKNEKPERRNQCSLKMVPEISLMVLFGFVPIVFPAYTGFQVGWPVIGDIESPKGYKNGNNGYGIGE